MVLPGYSCTSQIWRSIRGELDAFYDISWVDWPCKLISEFHAVEAFAHWLRQATQPAPYDFVIGHSMGGLVALELARMDKELFRRIILVDTFLISPPPFFQNLFVGDTLGPNEYMVLDMLEREQMYYSPRLRAVLKQVDMRPLAANLCAKISAIYGDRGSGDRVRVQRELAWPEELQRRVEVRIVPSASHFPMIENPGETIDILLAIL
ncbi:MAG TPA: alpha/beta hydrolase [Anaerolineales bacterium]|nr:alpha/beta hydrolase [Anaerolineales bacterium]